MNAARVTSLIVTQMFFSSTHTDPVASRLQTAVCHLLCYNRKRLYFLDSNCSVRFKKVQLLMIPESAMLTPALRIIFDPVFKTL